MLEITTTRHNPMVDPSLHVWGWEIPVYLFVGGVVAGMMILAGIAMMRVAKGEDPKRFFSIQTPLLGFMLLNVGMLALFLDLAHPLYVWAVYLTFEPMSPMSWGSWVLLIVYGVLLVSALIRLPDAWPWLGRRVPQLQQGVRLHRGASGPDDGARLDQRRARRAARHLHRHPAQHDGRAAALEHDHPRPAVPRLRAIRRGGDGASRHAHLPGPPGARRG